MSRIALISPAGTGGWRRNERELGESLTRLGVAHEVISAAPGRTRPALRWWPAGSLLVARAGRRAALEALGRGAEALLMVNSTSALLLPWKRLARRGVRVGIRIDSPASSLWPSATHALTHRLERRALRRAAVALATGARSAELVAPLADRTVTVPVALTGEAGSPPPDLESPYVLAYAGQPSERGLDRLCAAWAELPAGARETTTLAVTGISAGDAERFLRRRGVAAPGGVRWLGTVPRERYRDLLAGAAAFVSVPRIEGHGIAALEALAAGIPLATAPALGANEAAGPARELAPALVAATAEPEPIAAAIAAALEMDDAARAEYARGSREAVAGHSREAADAGMREALAAIGVQAG